MRGCLNVAPKVKVGKIKWICMALSHETSKALRRGLHSVTVCAECRRSTSVLGEEIRTHNFTSLRTSLAESPGEDAVPVVYSDSSVSAWYGTALPRRDTSVDH